MEELRNVIQKLRNGKSPGHDINKCELDCESLLNILNHIKKEKNIHKSW